MAGNQQQVPVLRRKQDGRRSDRPINKIIQKVPAAVSVDSVCVLGINDCTCDSVVLEIPRTAAAAVAVAEIPELHTSLLNK